METTSPPTLSTSGRGRVRMMALGFLALGPLACAGGGPPELPDPRPIVVRSGERIHPDMERLREIDNWLRPQMNNIEQDPTFMVEVAMRDTPAYPWESLFIVADTAKIGVEGGKSPQAQYSYMLYAHYHLMHEMDRLDEFLPEELVYADEYTRERAIMERVAESWYYARGLYDAEAFELLEEILYANEFGHLDAFILTARPEDFPEERKAWLEEDPEGLETYRSWFVETFTREPPGLRDSGSVPAPLVVSDGSGELPPN